MNPSITSSDLAFERGLARKLASKAERKSIAHSIKEAISFDGSLTDRERKLLARVYESVLSGDRLWSDGHNIFGEVCK